MPGFGWTASWLHGRCVAAWVGLVGCAWAAAGIVHAHRGKLTCRRRAEYRMAALPKLTYFDIEARGFAIRAALRYAKVPFEDARIKFAELETLRGPDGYNDQVPLGSLPTLEVDGHVYIQSTCLARWAAKKSDLYPKDELGQLKCEMVMDTANELVGKLPQHKDPAEKKRLREEFAANTLPRYLRFIESNIKGPYILGDKFCVADLQTQSPIDMILGGRADFIPPSIITDKYPKLAAYHAAVRSHPIAKAEIDAKKASI